TRTPVQSALAPRLPFEVLDRVRHVRVAALDAGRLERAIEQPARRADERPPRTIFLVARDLAHEHHARVARTFAEDRLRSSLPYQPAATARGRRSRGAPRMLLGQELASRPLLRSHPRSAVNRTTSI